MAPISHPALVNPIFKRFIEVVDASERRPTPVAVPYRELTSVVRGQGWARAIAFGLLSLALSLAPLFATESIGRPPGYMLPPYSANELHFAHTQDGDIVQIVGIGPFEVTPT